MLLVVVLGVYATLTHRYARLWTHPLPVWTRAAEMAPEKPRPWLHVAAWLVSVGKFDDARSALDRAERLAQRPHVPPWDRAITREIVAQNRAALGAVAERMARAPTT